MKSLSIQAKLDAALQPDQIAEEFNSAFDNIIGANNGFKSLNQFNEYLTEGTLLNVNAIASKALSIPCGEYMVWVTDVGHTMLVPTQMVKNSSEVFEHTSDQYEVSTPQLLKHWNKIERVLAEEDKGPPDDTKYTPDISGIKRKAMFRAMQNHGYDKDYGALAARVGVQTPMISRILSGDRTPSMGTASQICDALNSDPTAIFPDIFNVQQGKKYKPKEVTGNRGSGMSGAAKGSKRKGAATEKWTQGSTKGESLIPIEDIITELDNSLNDPINNSQSDDLSNQLKDQQQQIDKKEAERKQKITPQIDEIKSDIEELSQGLNNNTQYNVSSSEELSNMQNQIDDINIMINKLSSNI